MSAVMGVEVGTQGQGSQCQAFPEAHWSGSSSSGYLASCGILGRRLGLSAAETRGDLGETQGRPRGTYKYEEVENKHQILHAAQTVALHGVRPRKHKDTQFFTWRHSDSHSWSPAQPHPGAPVPTPLERVKIGSLLGQHWVRTAGTLIWNFNSYSLVPWLWSATIL